MFPGRQKHLQWRTTVLGTWWEYVSVFYAKREIAPPKSFASSNRLVSVSVSLHAVTLFFRLRGLQLMASTWLTTFHSRDVYLDFEIFITFSYFYFYLYVLLLVVWNREAASKSELMELSLLEIFATVIGWSVYFYFNSVTPKTVDKISVAREN